MPSKYDAAFAELHQAPFDKFVAERKRLAGELEAAGDKSGAASLAKVTRPPVSAWAVNQLYWRDKKAFSALFKTAEPLRDADPTPEETAAHRDAIAALRTGAARLLAQAGKSATEATLRRVTTTLSALAATGGFEPDPPGALQGDRDPPGFNVAGLMGSKPSQRKADERKANAADAKRDKAQAKRHSADAKRREKAEAVAEKRRLERERVQQKAERERLERKVRIAKGVLDARKEEVTRLRERLAEAEDSVEGARGVVRELEKELAKTSR